MFIANLASWQMGVVQSAFIAGRIPTYQCIYSCSLITIASLSAKAIFRAVGIVRVVINDDSRWNAHVISLRLTRCHECHRMFLCDHMAM